jgi:hypothetical protein
MGTLLTLEPPPSDADMTGGDKVTKYKVLWDNGVSACETFPDMFDTFEAADAFGRDWADESNLRDFGTLSPEGEDGYSYEVIEVKVPATPSDEEKDAHEGAEHIRTRDHEPR